jgi:hypothetical protein
MRMGNPTLQLDRRFASCFDSLALQQDQRLKRIHHWMIETPSAVSTLIPSTNENQPRRLAWPPIKK